MVANRPSKWPAAQTQRCNLKSARAALSPSLDLHSCSLTLAVDDNGRRLDGGHLL